jgi:uncharacterized cupredoxin-like copper-binding protein
MREQSVVLTGWLLTASISGSSAFGAGDLAQQEPIEVRLELGTADKQEHAFRPAELTFETGKLYKLVIHNPSKDPHYFTSHEFTQKIYTRKLQVMAAAGSNQRIAEIKGAVREVEIYPGGLTEWWFVPVSTGTIRDLHCHVKDSDGHTHAQKGMTGTIVIR